MPTCVMTLKRAVSDFKHDCNRSWPKVSRARIVWAVIVDSGLRAVLYIRLQQVAVDMRWNPLARLISRLNLNSNSIDVVPGAVFGPGLVIKHPVGIVVGCNVVAGRNLTLLQGTTLGQIRVAERSAAAENPNIGDGVTVGANAVLLGKIKVGNGCIIGASAVVMTDVPPLATIVGNPGKIVSLKKLPQEPSE